MNQQNPNHLSRKTGLIGAAVLSLGLLAPLAAQAGASDHAKVSIHFGTTAVAHAQHVRYDRHYDRYDHRYDRQNDRHAQRHRGAKSAYFARPYKPLNYKRWQRIERRVHEYTPRLGHLNRYERRQLLGHGYDRYLRDHRRWSKRVTRRAYRSNRLYGSYDHDYRNCNDRSHRHTQYRRW